MEGNVVLLDYWASVYAMRARIALALKEVRYECKEENILNPEKSSLLLKMNPVHKKIPVLIHNDKPICESLNVVEYIDQVWNQKSPLLPSDPYQRSQARFWANYLDQKINLKAIWLTKGEEREKGKKEVIQGLKMMEGMLGEKQYFGGNKLDYVDVALLPFSSWFHTLESIANFSVKAETPKLVEWVKRCMENESVSKSLPDPQKVHDLVLPLMKKLGVE